MLIPEAIGHSVKILLGKWDTSQELLVSKLSTILPTATAFGCPPEQDGKILLMKILHALAVGHRGIKLELS